LGFNCGISFATFASFTLVIIEENEKKAPLCFSICQVLFKKERMLEKFQWGGVTTEEKHCFFSFLLTF